MTGFFRYIFIISLIILCLSQKSSGQISETGEREHFEKSLWVWNTSEILSDSSLREEFSSFLEEEKFTSIFLQIPEYKYFKTNKVPELISDLSSINVKVYALDGNRDFALPEKHEEVIAVVDKIIQYNEESKPSEKFYGIQYDIEPYLLPEFKTDKQEWILENYIELLKKISDRTNPAGLTFNVAIPFWYDSPKIKTVALDGIRKPVIEHIIDLTDNIAIMDYRTEAKGDNGVIALAQNELTCASLKGKEVFIGLETKSLSDDRLSFADLGLDKLLSVMEEAEKELKNHKSFGGFAIHSYKSYLQLVKKYNNK
jgi:hypothetical protein